MKTCKPCFADGIKLMLWQEANCIKCKKAVWYNHRLDKMPQYRCAVQKQIEAQTEGRMEINERTYEITRSKRCSCFKPKEERSDTPAEVLDFSKGESLVDTIITDASKPRSIIPGGIPMIGEKWCTQQLSFIPSLQRQGSSSMTRMFEARDKYKKNAYTRIAGAKGLLNQTAHKSSDEAREAMKKCKDTTDLMIGVDQRPKDIATTPDPALFKLSMETGVDYNALKDADHRMLDTIKDRGDLPPVFKELDFKKQVKSDVHTMLETFTWEENMMIAFVPLVISHIAWLYAEKVREYCADHRIPETVKLSRAVRHVRQEYIDSLKKDLDAKHISRIEEQTEQFCKLYANDFTIMWYCVNAEFCKLYPDDELSSMRTDAYTSILMCRFLVEHNKRMDKIIESKMGFAQSIKNPYMDKLETCMDAYCGEHTIKNNDHINACLRILEKNIKSINFEIDDSEPK